MTRRYTLRGEITIEGSGSIEERLFSYEANDLSSGWIVRSAQIWDAGRSRAGGSTTADNNHTMLKLQLQTDTIGASDFFEANENRAFAWITATYAVTDQTPYNQALVNSDTILDPDHLIARELWGNFTFEAGGGQEAQSKTIGYLIILEKKKTSPAENILQQVKSVAQDINN